MLLCIGCSPTVSATSLPSQSLTQGTKLLSPQTYNLQEQFLPHNFTNFITRFAFVTLASIYSYICTSAWNTKNDGHTWAGGNCSSHFPPCALLQLKNTLVARKCIAETMKSTMTSRHFCHRNILFCGHRWRRIC